jgi:hypothetical protein
VPHSAVAEAAAERAAEVLEESRSFCIFGVDMKPLPPTQRIPEYAQPLPWMSDAPIVRAAQHPLWSRLDVAEVDPGSADALAALLASPNGAWKLDGKTATARLEQCGAAVAGARFRPCCAFYVCAATSRIVREPCRDCVATAAAAGSLAALPPVRAELESCAAVPAASSDQADRGSEDRVDSGFDGVARGGMLCDEMGLGKVRGPSGSRSCVICRKRKGVLQLTAATPPSFSDP